MVNLFSICICTYKRPNLLSLLINDLANQSLVPEQIIIIDGYPSSNSVFKILKENNFLDQIKITYIPSNHGNLAYQRYLGWRVAKENDVNLLLYLDDDLRIYSKDELSILIEPFSWQWEKIVGVTTVTINKENDILNTSEILLDQFLNKPNKEFFVKNFGSSKKIQPGGLAPSGQRVLPKKSDSGFEFVEWLYGRVMFYSMEALTKDCFSEDLFALDHIRCDLGEDTFLSRQVSQKGQLVLLNDVEIHHPNADLPKCYPIESKKFAYATAYSRRFLNDHYRITEPPHFSDRVALVKSYLGNNLINLMRALSHPAKFRFSYAWGYFIGSIRGIFQKPTAKNLTPDIDWYKDAEEALSKQVIIQ